MVDFLLIKNNLFKVLEALLRLHALCYLEGNLLAIPVFFSLEECLVTLPTLSFLESLLMIRQEFSHLRKIWRLPGTSLMADYLRQKTFFFFDLILLGPPMFFVMRYIMHTGDFWVLHELPLFVLMAWLEFNVGEPWRFMVAVLSISLPRDKLFDLQKMRYRGYLLAVLLTCCVVLFPTNAAPVAEHIVFFCSGLLLILLFRNKYIQAAIITLFILSFVSHFWVLPTTLVTTVRVIITVPVIGYLVYQYIKDVISIVGLFVTEIYKGIQQVKTSGLRSVANLTGLLSSHMRPHLFLFWYALSLMYATLPVIDMYTNSKNKTFWLCLETFLYNTAIVNCNTIVGIAATSLIVMSASRYIRQMTRTFIYSCKEMTPMVDSDSFIVFFLIIIFAIYIIQSSVLFTYLHEHNKIDVKVIFWFIFFHITTVFINNIYQMVDSDIFAIRASVTHIFKPIRVLFLDSFLLIMMLCVVYSIYHLVSFKLSCVIVITGLSKCIQISGSIIIYILLLHSAFPSLDKVGLVSSLKMLDFVGVIFVAYFSGFSFPHISQCILLCYHSGWNKLIHQRVVGIFYP